MIAVSPAADGRVRNGAYAALYASILGPIFLTLLMMFVSGLPLQERPGAKKRYEKCNHWPEYKQWTERTSMLVPFPPQLYSEMPTILKRTIFLEFPMYVSIQRSMPIRRQGSRAKLRRVSLVKSKTEIEWTCCQGIILDDTPDRFGFSRVSA